MSNLITAAQYTALSVAEQTEYINQNGANFAPVIDALFKDTPETTEPSVQSEFEIEGDAVFLNLNITVHGEKFRIKSIKLTEKRQCMDKWVKGENGDKGYWEGENADVMSIIHMVRTYGAAKVNEASVFEGHLGKAGEKSTELRDPFAALAKQEA